MFAVKFSKFYDKMLAELDNPNMQPIVLTFDQEKLIGKITEDQNSEFTPALQEILKKIACRNQAVNEMYSEYMASLFDGFSKIQAEIVRMALKGFTLIGYKGTNGEIAESINLNGVNVEFQSGEYSGKDRGEGFYLTPNYTAAVDYAVVSVRKKIAYNSIPQVEELKTPPDGTSSLLTFKFDAQCKAFEQLDVCKQDMKLLLCYVENFFNLRELNTGYLTDDEAAKHFSQGYAYLQGKAMGWEMVFRPTEDIYSRISTTTHSYLSINGHLPDLPAGTDSILSRIEKLAHNDNLQPRKKLPVKNTL